MRINKFLADCGIGSRRSCDKIVEEGRVQIDGRTARLGDEVGDRNIVMLDGEVLNRNIKHSYYLMNKPKGCVCTVKDDKGRRTVMDYLPESAGRVYPVGRLDYDTEGLLLFTDDGDLAFRLTHPKNEIPKTYLVKIEGIVSEQDLNRLRSGVFLDGKRTQKSHIKVVSATKDSMRLHITITEGKNRQVRRMFAAIGKEVVFLKRIRIGELGLGALERGKTRKLSSEEVYYLKNL